MVIAEAGLGDVIKLIHWCNKVFSSNTENTILNISFRPEYINEFLKMIVGNLPNTTLINDGELQNKFNNDSLDIVNKYPGYHSYHRLKYGRDPEFYEDTSWFKC